LRAGFAPALPLHLLLAFVRDLRVHASDVAVQVTHLHSVDQLERLRSGNLDIAIVVDPQEDPALEFERIFDGELLGACVSSQHPLAGRAVLGPEDLRDETVVTLLRSLNPVVYERSFERYAAAGYSFKGFEEAGTTGRDLLLAVASGRGVALVPRSLDELGAEDVSFCSLDPSLRMPPAAVAWQANTTPGLRPILATVRAIARKLVESIDGVEPSSAEAAGARAAETRVTARQLDVLRLLAEGKSTEDIAAELGLSGATVRNHIAALMSALGVHSRLQAVIAAKRAGLLDL
jgi:DNA-binding transcriptional LysR family regulator